jgi:hypothetical protein
LKLTPETLLSLAAKTPEQPPKTAGEEEEEGEEEGDSVKNPADAQTSWPCVVATRNGCCLQSLLRKGVLVAARAAAQEEEEQEQEERARGETTWSSLRIAIMRAIMRPKQTLQWYPKYLLFKTFWLFTKLWHKP